MTLARKPVDLVQLVREIVERLESDRTRVVGAGTLIVSADADQIDRVLTNLVDNALKYSTPSTPIVVRVSQQDGEAIVSVTDQGAGIPPDEKGLLFERFRRGRAGSNSDRAGLGLGLYIARLLVEAHKGRIWVESEVETGSTFHFALPMDAPDVDSAAS